MSATAGETPQILFLGFGVLGVQLQLPTITEQEYQFNRASLIIDRVTCALSDSDAVQCLRPITWHAALSRNRCHGVRLSYSEA
jgi:hypothetical protein